MDTTRYLLPLKKEGSILLLGLILRAGVDSVLMKK